MAKTRIAINGFGRIGRLAYRLLSDNDNFEVVAFNDLTDAETLAYLLKYDTAHGRFKTNEVTVGEDSLTVSGKEVKVFSERDPRNLPWKDLKIDLVLECTGFFNSEEKAAYHIEAGAKKVLCSAPASGSSVKTVVFGVNDDILDGSETIVSAASCTTNCLAPVAKVLDDEFGIEKGFMTTVHAYTGDQNLMDSPHAKGIFSRRGRAAAANIIPTSTGAAKAIGLVLPQLKGKLDGTALRVPTITGSLVDLTVELGKEVTIDQVNAAMKNAANASFGYTEDPIVSSDVIGSRFGSIYDANTTQIVDVDGKQLLKVMAWYDNEMSYTAQLVRTLEKMAAF